jgi:hypothetical protein
MTNLLQAARMRNARGSFWRLIAWLSVAGVAMVFAALYYLSLYGSLTVPLVVATSIGVFISILLGGGLMAAGFLSSNSGHDERAAAATTAPPVVDQER